MKPTLTKRALTTLIGMLFSTVAVSQDLYPPIVVAPTPAHDYSIDQPSVPPSGARPTGLAVDPTPATEFAGNASNGNGHACNPCPQPVKNCTCPACSAKKLAALKKAAGSAHKPLHYLNDFNYLNDPCHDGHNFGDCLKRRGGGLITYDIGGQYRMRAHHEENHRGLGLTGRHDTFLLHRTRLFANVEIGDNIRLFGETLDANSNYENFSPRPIEENRWELQNLFADVKLLDGDRGKVVARVGRQEIALGAQRYVSPLDWANTRRTFDGGRITYTSDDWTTDGFWLAPMVRNVRAVDEASDDVSLYGIYSTYKALDNGTLDMYWLGFTDDAAGFDYHSIGGRYSGKVPNTKILTELEGAYQFGTNADSSDHQAGFFTAGLGRKFACAPFSPTSWLYFDWASGDDAQGAGNGHHHFQPLAHKYNGFMDLFGRRNLIDLNWQNTLQVSRKVKLLAWYHSFWLENSADTPYNVTMSAFNPAVTPVDDHLGQELDIVVSIGINERSNVLYGYSHFWTGAYFDSPGLPANVDADFFYAQYTFNF